MTLKEEEKLITQIQSGDKNKFSKLYEAYYKDVYRYGRAMTADNANAEDLVQNVFLKGLEKISSYQSRGTSIKYWLITIARNLIFDNAKKKKESPLDPDLEIYSKELSESEKNAGLSYDIKEVLEKLPKEVREVIILKIWEEYKFSEIAELTGEGESAVKTRFYRGLEVLKADLAKSGYGKEALASAVLFGEILSVKNLKLFEPVNSLLGKVLEHAVQNSTISGASKLIVNEGSKMVIDKLLIAKVVGVVAAVSLVGAGGYLTYDAITAEPNDENIEENKGNEVNENEDGQKESELVVAYKPFDVTIGNEISGDAKVSGKAPDSAVVTASGDTLLITDTQNGFEIKVVASYETFIAGYLNYTIIGSTADGSEINRVQLSNRPENEYWYVSTKYLSTDKVCESVMGGSNNPPCGESSFGDYDNTGNLDGIYVISCVVDEAGSLNVCDEVVKGLSFESIEVKTELVTFNCDGYKNGNLINDYWFVSFEIPEGVTTQGNCGDSGEIKLYSGESYIHFRVAVDAGPVPLDDKFVTIDPERKLVRNSLAGLKLPSYGDSETYYHGWVATLKTEEQCNNLGPMYEEIKYPCGNEVIDFQTYPAYMDLYVSKVLSDSQKEDILELFDQIILSYDSGLNSANDWQYSYVTTAVPYSPDTAKYVGFQICNQATSTCTVYGVEVSKIAKVVMGGAYTLSFNTSVGGGAAAGTTYYKVTGDFEIK